MRVCDFGDMRPHTCPDLALARLAPEDLELQKVASERKAESLTGFFEAGGAETCYAFHQVDLFLYAKWLFELFTMVVCLMRLTDNLIIYGSLSILYNMTG